MDTCPDCRVTYDENGECACCGICGGVAECTPDCDCVWCVDPE
jgi:hypothetical protein